jgi:hypothetical protein
MGEHLRFHVPLSGVEMPTESSYSRNRLRLISGLLVLIALASVAILAWREVQVRRAVFTSIIENRATTAAREFDAFFTPVQAQLGLIRAWGLETELKFEDAAALNAFFIPLLESQGWASALAIAGEGGLEYELLAGDDGWQSSYELSGAFALKKSEWYRQVVRDPASGGVEWTPADPGNADADPVLYASTSWTDPVEPNLPRVVALGVSRAALDEVIDRFPVTENGMLALLSSTANVSWHMPAVGEGFESTDSEALLDPVEEPERLLAEALYVWSREGGPNQSAFRFPHEGEAWWAWRTPLETGGGSRELLLLLPASDLSARLLTVTSPLTYGMLLLFGACVIALFRLALGFRGRLDRITQAVTHTDASETELRQLIDSGEGDRLEFKSTLRWNLRENRPGKEIELSWLKTVVAFLNTDGGTLLVGVADNGKIVGCSKDGFRNDDKYLLHVNNLVQQHIGVEFSRYLRYDLRPVDGENVLVFDVQPSDEPSFLKTNEDDVFYVRMGPASRKLSLRKTLEYLKDFNER